jgi:DNA helicase-2/ATP-dependent DNA helicase PcrA
LATLIARAERGDDGPLRRVASFFERLRDHAALVADPRIAVVVPSLTTAVTAGEDVCELDEPPGAAVAVLTVHQAKGLEFPVVFVLGLADGRFPVRRRRAGLPLPRALIRGALDGDAAALAEERRLCYVALTRARDELILCHATRYGPGRHRRPSPFVAEALGHASEPAPAAVGIMAVLDEPAPVPVASSPRPASGPLHLSYTQIDDYLTCPHKYRLRHVLRVPCAPDHALVVGTALHQAVAAVNLGRMRGRPLDGDGALGVLDAHWQSEGFLSREHEEARYAAARSAVLRFAARPSDETRLLAVERPFSVGIGADTVIGRYDAVAETVEGVVVTDYKSTDVRDQRRADERARGSLQLLMYALAWEAESGQLPDRLELHFLEGGVVGRTTPAAARLERARGQVARAAAGIRDGRFEPTPGYPACSWCPYRTICPAVVA